MANTTYPNFVIENWLKDQLETHLDMLRFVATDEKLAENVGLTAKINVYTATDGTEALDMGEGNTDTIESGYTQIEVPVVCLQNRFKWYDEQEMEDPAMVEKGVMHTVQDLTNKVNNNAITEFLNGTQRVYTDAFDYDSVVDACAEFPDNEDEALAIFALVNPADRKELKKSMKGTLQYVKEYAAQGYIGSVNGVNFYGNKQVTAGTIVFAVKGAVRWLPKKGLEVEYERNSNTRENIRYTRQYGAFALVDDTKVVLLVKGEAPATTYTVTYNGNESDGGTVPVDSNSPYESGATVTVLGNTGTLTKTGKTFGGWNTKADGTGTAYAADATFTIAADTVLYAVWTD